MLRTPGVLWQLYFHAQWLGQAAAGTTLKVTPTGGWTALSGFSSKSSIYTLPSALAIAKAGDTVYLADGEYSDRVDSVTDGESGNPITVMGSEYAVIRSESPLVRIQHSWITLKGFTVNGKLDFDDTKDSYANKCVRVEGTGTSEDEPLEGFVMEDMIVMNCGTECVRLKNFVIGAEIRGNNIRTCGLYDYVFDQGGKNGEGIYIGTSSTQHGEDKSSGNIISGNRIATHGSECVDVKEGSYGNVIEENTCSDQLEEKSGCFSVRGDSNTVRNNVAKDCEGVGVRLGGAKVDKYQYGQANDVYSNIIRRAGVGFMMVLASPQGDICDNVCQGDDCEITGDYADDLGDTWYRDC